MSMALVNGETCDLGRAMDRSLLWFLRDDLGLSGTKPGCGEGVCGACTVLVDGSPVLACRTRLEQVAGREVVTIEGLAQDGRLHPVQRALAEERASQCGYCTPGIALRAAALLAGDDDPDDEAIAAALEPSLCRCGCYPRLPGAIRRAAALARSPGTPAGGDGSGDASDGTALEALVRVEPPDLRRPERPWDLTPVERRDYFEVLGDGLVAVWEPEPASGGTSSAGDAAWVHVGGSGRVLAFSGKVDVGQDNTTAFRLLVAEELGARLRDVAVVLGDTDLCPFDIGTFGSRSIPDAGEPLRRAAAGARRALSEMAAQRLGVPPGRLLVADGEVTGGPSGERLRFGELVAGERRVELVRGEPGLVPPERRRLVGHEGHSRSRLDVVTGSLRFVSDLRRPEMGYGAVLRPPVPGATLGRVDTAAARELSGVTVVEDGGWVGVVATDLPTARRALAAVEAEWDLPAPGPDDLEAHLRSHTRPASGWERAVEEQVGDVDAARAAAPVQTAATYTTTYLAHVPLETRAALAEWATRPDGGEHLTVWTGTQVPFGVRRSLAEAFDLDQDAVRVVVPPTGSGFGGKHLGEVAVEAARLARSARRPVMVHWTRAEELRFGYLRPMAVIDVRAALDPSGEIAAFDLLDLNAGSAGATFPYKAASRRFRSRPASSPLAQGSYRALGAPANNFARESHIDELAAAVGADPLEYRRRLLEDDRLAAVLDACVERFGWRGGSGVPARGAPRLGQGVALGVEKGGRVATCAEVAVAEGKVRVTRVVTAYECGAVVNPDTVRNQVEGGTVMALGGALFERAAIDHGRLVDATLSGYRVPRLSDAPPIEVVLLDRPDLPGAGAGETPLVAVAPAVANAIFDATGVRLRSLPLVPDGRLP